MKEFELWEVHDDGEKLLGRYKNFQKLLDARPSYYRTKLDEMSNVFGCLIVGTGAISHLELRFPETLSYNDRQLGG